MPDERKKTLKRLPGVKQLSVDLKYQTAAVVFDEDCTNEASIQSEIKDAGFHAETVTVTKNNRLIPQPLVVCPLCKLIEGESSCKIYR